MSHLFARLSRLFEEGHQAPVTGLLDDAHFAPTEQATDAAVLLAITDRPADQGGPGLILTQRPTTMRDHPGQVALPGGKLEQGETATTAALREAEEELALKPEYVQLIGVTDRYNTGTNFNITPIVGIIPPDLDLVPHPREVDSWFEVPLDIVLRTENWNRAETLWRGEMRHYLEMQYKGFRIWGVTAAIIFNFSQRINVTELLDG